MLANVVQLYRESNRPALDGATFTYAGPISAELDKALVTCEALGEQFGRFEDAPERDGAGNVSFRWRLAANENARFYDSANQLADLATSPSQGILPKNYYLVEENFLDGDQKPPGKLNHLLNLVKLIQLLSQLAQSLSSTQLDAKTLIFVIPAEERSPPRTFELKTRITSKMLESAPPELAVLKLLVSENDANSLHIDERRSLFRLAVADTLQRLPVGSDGFAHLVSEWPKVLDKYRYDVDCYISNFSFDKVRREVAASELEFVSKIQSVVGDSAAKLLGLPLSLATVIGVYHASTLVEGELLVLGALVVATIFSFVVSNQQLQLNRIDHGFRVVFDPLKEKSATLPTKIETALNEALQGFTDQYRLSTRALTLVRVLAWIPVFVGTLLVAYRFNPDCQKVIQDIGVKLLLFF